MNPSVLTVEGLSSLLFLAILGVTAAGAVIATCSTRLIRAVIGLALCFLGVAGIYYYLNSAFVALMQILIYVGAVCVTIIFAIMLADTDEDNKQSKGNLLVGPLGLLASGTMAFGIGALGVKTQWPEAAHKVNSGAVADVGQSLLTTYSMVFELISVVLLVAIVGSLALARAGRSK
jgi:NADH-quinone oxidoreductase subunit J